MSDEPEDEGFNEPTAPAWMATFGDLMSLLLTFFVLLLSFASMDERKLAAAAGSMRDAFGVQTVRPGQIEALADTLVNMSETESTPKIRVIDTPARMIEREQSLLERLRRTIEKRELQRVVTAETSPRGVVLRMEDQLLFDPASADLRTEAVVFLSELSELIRNVPGAVSIEGHTDTLVAGGAQGSNWDLSARRAVAVLRHLIESERVPSARLRATAFGATQPIESNENPRGRARNRRVDFVFLRTEIELTGNPGAAQVPRPLAQ